MNPIVLYDGVCGLCNRLVRFILNRDRRDHFRFAALQAGFARATLKRHGLNPDALDTFYVVFNYGEPAERVLARDEGVAAVLESLGGVWAFQLAMKWAWLPMAMASSQAIMPTHTITKVTSM